MVEIASDANSAEHMIHKCMRYLEYGAKEVWVLFPEEKLLQVYQPDRTAKIFQQGTYQPERNLEERIILNVISALRWKKAESEGKIKYLSPNQWYYDPS